MENRAAVFTSKPQAVEVYQAGGWWAGELLGWRHSDDGSCQVWVRVVLDGVEETAWTDLSTLRLPERHLAMAPDPASGESAEREMSVARHPSSRREHRAGPDVSATASLPMVRDLSVVSGAPVAPTGGRRRAPEVPAAVSTGGRRRAPETGEMPVAASTGGRRRAPETGEAPVVPAGGRRRAPDAAVAPVAPVAPVAVSTGGRRRAPEVDAATPATGRRRAAEVAPATGSRPAGLFGRRGTSTPTSAPVDPGRHRTAADTGLLPAVSGASSSVPSSGRSAAPATSESGRPIPAARPSLPERMPSRGSGWSPPSGLEAELLTRPMRLSDHAPNSGRPRLDGSLRGV